VIEIRCRGPAQITLRGHAGSAEYGHDLICAAVSALVMALAENLRDFPGREIRLESGNASLACPHTPEAEGIFACFRKGFQLLGELFPEHVQCEVKAE